MCLPRLSSPYHPDSTWEGENKKKKKKETKTPTPLGKNVKTPTSAGFIYW